VTGPQGFASQQTFYQRVRVIAPAEARRCRVGLFDAVNAPERSAAPNAQGEVMLTLDYTAQRTGVARISCELSGGGVVEREARRIAIGETQFRVSAEPFVHVSYPPLLHMVSGDPGARARWNSLRSEICGEPRSAVYEKICEDAAWLVLQAADIGDPP
jgi:hypothetical protein